MTATPARINDIVPGSGTGDARTSCATPASPAGAADDDAAFGSRTPSAARTSPGFAVSGSATPNNAASVGDSNTGQMTAVWNDTAPLDACRGPTARAVTAATDQPANRVRCMQRRCTRSGSGRVRTYGDVPRWRAPSVAVHHDLHRPRGGVEAVPAARPPGAAFAWRVSRCCRTSTKPTAPCGPFTGAPLSTTSRAEISFRNARCGM